MSRKRIIVGQSEWAIADEHVVSVVDQIKAAMTDGTVAQLELLDGAGREVTVYLNGRAAESVVVDLDRGPRPSEISG